MNAKERYNKIITTIEELVQGENIDGIVIPIPNHDISNKAFDAANCSKMSDNSKNVLFLFLINCTLIDYINKRKMVATYKEICDCKEWNSSIQNRIIEMSGLSDYPAFIKKFKKHFGVSPKKAFMNKETAIIPQIQDWDSINIDSKSMFVKFDEADMMNEKFGISREKFMAAHVAANLQSFYKLNDYESELAFKLAKDKKFSLEDTFEYVYNYVWSFIDEDSPERDSRLEQDLLKQEVIHMYFNCKMSFNEILIVLVALNECELPREIKDTNRLYLLGFRRFSKQINEFNESNSGITKALNWRLDHIKYEDIFKYFEKNASQKDTEQVFFKYVESSSFFEFDEALDVARNEVLELFHLKHYHETPFIEEENYLGYDEFDDEFIENEDEYDYEPDFDDPEITEDIFMNHDDQENDTEYEDYIGVMNFTFEEFNLFCDEIDADDSKEGKSEKKRKLIGYTNLDIEQVGK